MSAAASLEGAFRFVLWAQGLHRQPTIADIANHWGCSRATAYRYRQALADAMGEHVLPTPIGTGLPDEHRAEACVRTRLLTRACA